MTEQGYQAKVIKYLAEKGAYVVKTVSASKKGVPDVIACYKGKFIAIEMKTPEKRHNTTPLQDYNIARVLKAGGYAMVVVHPEELHWVIKEIDNAK